MTTGLTHDRTAKASMTRALLSELSQLRLGDLDALYRSVRAGKNIQELPSLTSLSGSLPEPLKEAGRVWNNTLKLDPMTRAALTPGHPAHNSTLFEECVVKTWSHFFERIRKVERDNFSREIDGERLFQAIPRSNFSDLPGIWRPDNFHGDLWEALLPYTFDASRSKTDLFEEAATSGQNQGRLEEINKRYLRWIKSLVFPTEWCVPFKADIKEVFATGMQIDSHHVRLIACYSLVEGWRMTNNLTLKDLDLKPDDFKGHLRAKLPVGDLPPRPWYPVTALTYAEWDRLPSELAVLSTSRMAIDRITWTFDEQEAQNFCQFAKLVLEKANKQNDIWRSTLQSPRHVTGPPHAHKGRIRSASPQRRDPVRPRYLRSIENVTSMVYAIM